MKCEKAVLSLGKNGVARVLVVNEDLGL